MKLYVLRERWGHHTISSREPSEKTVPKDPIVRAGIGINMVDWGDWIIRPVAERVIIYNVLVSYALDTLGLHAPHVIPWVNAAIAKSIAFELTWGMWLWAGAIAVYAGVVLILVYSAPAQHDLYIQEVFPWRYLFRYQSRVWAADLIAISRRGRPYYNICYEIGDVIVGEDRSVHTRMGVLDRWNTGYIWQQRRDRFLRHDVVMWFDCYVEFIGFCEHIGPDLYVLKYEYRDPFISELPRPFVVPTQFRCREWDSSYRFP